MERAVKALLQNDNIRNIAIIAHVDHGKTTLVDFMLRQAGTFHERQTVDDRVMDSMDLERERGITISAKNCSVQWRGRKINILDTPGHADFGGEVERALMMVNGAILLVDSSEGPLPQTRFVLKKALDLNLPIILVINKIDRKDARTNDVLNEVYDLFLDLDANEEQIEFPVLYAVAREGIAKRSIDEEGTDLIPLFETIMEYVPGPSHDPNEPFQMLVADLDYSDYLGRLAIGRIAHGKAHENDDLVCINADGAKLPLRVTNLQVYNGLSVERRPIVEPGDIALLAGIDNVHIGDTIATSEQPKALRRVIVDEPTVSMTFHANTSPFSGREGQFVQSAKVRERLFRETLRNVAIQVEDSPDGDGFTVKGRGEFQMAILIEQMRREGFEAAVGRPQVIMREKDGITVEPIEHLFVDCGEAFVGIVSEKLSKRRGKMTNLVNHGTGRARMEFSIPTRSLIGYRSEFLTDTRGTGIMNSYLEGFEPFRGEFPTRITGSMVSTNRGEAVAYALYNLEPRGTLFLTPNEPVYEGMIVGEHNRDNDLFVNPCKTKKLTNMRASGSDEATVLTPVLAMTLERAIGFIKEDEIVEVTPKSIRLRKRDLRGR
jgi:GTP-binding protein